MTSRSRSRLFATLLATSLIAFASISLHTPPSTNVYAAQTSTPPLANPDAVCASCHQAIYDHYEKTQMARGSGLATAGLIAGNYHHALSGVDYSIFQRNGSAWMSYKRPASDPRGALSGELHLQYFLGSAAQGRTYLYQIGDQWFELPINFYTHRNDWEMAPAYANVTHMPAPLPIDPNCLHCHVTGARLSQITARNAYAGQPFTQGGIGCSACHGNPAQHLAQHGHGPIANPATFAPMQRDSVCLICHLEGQAVVFRPNRSPAQFVPGDNLADIAVYFVKASQDTGGNRAVSQYEALLHSACKRAVGDKLTCTTCHDPHYTPPAAERVQYFRARCLACHTSPSMATHHPEQQDCAVCHMPSRSTADISHNQVTDHNIQARPETASLTQLPSTPTSFDLVPVGPFPASDREFGLAYAQLAERGYPNAGPTALRLLANAVHSGQSDHELEARYGYLLQTTGEPQKARIAYAAALQDDPYDPTALANLAVLDATSGHVPEAIHLLDRLTQADPSQTSAGLNLAFIECKLGQPNRALNLLNRLAAVNPDDPQLRDFIEHGNYAGDHCNVHPDTHPSQTPDESTGPQFTTPTN
ncbi:MAG: tetratricopeptide repeat protein [Acidobacteriaceae bacterium]